ncbi:MAG: hypothetical protein ACREMZ_12680 [Gemmatimonadales bacterium]
MWETAWEEAALARRFVERLREVPPSLLRPAVPPALDADPYLSAWTNVQAALANAPPVDRERLRVLTEELDRELSVLPMNPVMAQAARRSVRALLARRWLTTPESFTFVFEPFESVIPLTSLHA